MIKVFIRDQNKKQRTVNIDQHATLKAFIDKIKLVFLIDIENLSFKGKTLKPSQYDESIQDLDIKDKSIIQIVGKLQGGK